METQDPNATVQFEVNFDDPEITKVPGEFDHLFRGAENVKTPDGWQLGDGRRFGETPKMANDLSADDGSRATATAETMAIWRPQAARQPHPASIRALWRTIKDNVTSFVHARQESRTWTPIVGGVGGIAVMLAFLGGHEIVGQSIVETPAQIVQQDGNDGGAIVLPVESGSAQPSTKPTVVETVYERSPVQTESLTPQPGVTVTVTKTATGSASPSVIPSASASASGSPEVSASGSPSASASPDQPSSPTPSASGNNSGDESTPPIVVPSASATS